MSRRRFLCADLVFKLQGIDLVGQKCSCICGCFERQCERLDLSFKQLLNLGHPACQRLDQSVGGGGAGGGGGCEGRAAGGRRCCRGRGRGEGGGRGDPRAADPSPALEPERSTERALARSGAGASMVQIAPPAPPGPSTRDFGVANRPSNVVTLSNSERKSA